MKRSGKDYYGIVRRMPKINSTLEMLLLHIVKFTILSIKVLGKDNNNHNDENVGFHNQHKDNNFVHDFSATLNKFLGKTDDHTTVDKPFGTFKESEMEGKLLVNTHINIVNI